MRKTEVIETNPVSLKRNLDTWNKYHPNAEILKTNMTAINEYRLVYVIIYEEKPV